MFPYSTFNWCGIDGSQVLAHMTPVDQYNGQCTFGEIVKGISNNKNLEVTDQCLFLFGNGDGGGGPTPLMLEKLERLSSLSEKNPEVPSIKMGSPIDFFDDLCRQTDSGRRLPTWKGELYLELHRGTYTSQTGIKKGNRDMETTLRDLEYFATLASLKDPKYIYPKDELDAMWQDTMLAQFHDCLPGTTIKTVVLDNVEIYTKRGEQANKLIGQALAVLVDGSDKPTVVDPLRLERSAVYPYEGKLVWLRTDSSGIGALDQRPDRLTLPKAKQDGDSHKITNGRFSLSICDGRISSLYDSESKRELIAPGPGCDDAGLMIYEDLPLNYDAWDAEIYHLKCGSVIRFDSVSARQDSDLRATLVAEASFGKSKAVLEISLDAVEQDAGIQPIVRVKAKIDWHEKHKFLKCTSTSYGGASVTGLIVQSRFHWIYTARMRPMAPSSVSLNARHTATRPSTRPSLRSALTDLPTLAKQRMVSLLPVETSTVMWLKGMSCGMCSRLAFQCWADLADYRLSAHLPRRIQRRTRVTTISTLPLFPITVNSQQAMSKPRRSSSTTPLTVCLTCASRGVAADSLVVQGQLAPDLPRVTVSGPDAKAIQLETIKRGEDDDDKTKSIVLRMHESAGGRARGTLRMYVSPPQVPARR